MADINNMEEGLDNCKGGISSLDTQSKKKFSSMVSSVCEGAKQSAQALILAASFGASVSSAEVKDGETVQFDNGSTVTVTKSPEGDYSLKSVISDPTSQSVYMENGDILYITLDEHEQYHTYLGNWKKSKAKFENPQKFIEAKLAELDERGLENLTENDFFLYDGLQQAQLEMEEAETAKLDEILKNELAETARKKAETAKLDETLKNELAETARKKAETAKLDELGITISELEKTLGQ